MDADNHMNSAKQAKATGISRRQFLGGLGALTIAVNFKGTFALAADVEQQSLFAPNAFIRIDRDGFVTVVSSYIEMGQGTFTGLATLAAEELDITQQQLRVVGSPADAEKYVNPKLAEMGMPVQGTGGSTAMAGAWKVMRNAAASARYMLVAAAAKQWQVDASELTVVDGEIIHAASNRKASYGKFIEDAAKQPMPTPEQIKLKQPEEFKLIGNNSGMMRVDIPEKVNGKAIFTQDIKVPNMLVAVMAHPPRKFAKLRSVDSSKAAAIPGVEAIVPVPGDDVVQGGVAVLAKNTWIAKKGCEALVLEWDESSGIFDDTETLFKQYRAAAATKGLEVVNKGTQVDEPPQGSHVINAVFELPYLAHAPMEPMNAMVHFKGDSAEMWNGEQWHTGDQAAVAKELGLTPDKVTITQLYAGGSFGRRASPKSDYVSEAARLAKMAFKQGINAPIKLVWLREDDMGGLFYRPMTVHDARIVVDDKGEISSWRWRIAAQSFFGASKDSVDPVLSEGASDMPYAIDNLLVEQHIMDGNVPTSWLRSVGHTHTSVVGETLIDEAAAATKQDPYQFRRKLLAHEPKMLAVLDLVAEKSGWGTPLAPAKDGGKRGRGIAIRESFGTIVAQVAEVTVAVDGTYHVDKVYCAADCGQVINPVNIASQVEGGIGFAMSFLRQEITLKNGVVQQGNFNTYPVLRMNDAPVVEVFTVPSTNPPTGIGEPGVPPAVPAILNAISAITGKFARRLPYGTSVDA